ncbi:unnamed protein product [Caretta caretta]
MRPEEGPNPDLNTNRVSIIKQYWSKSMPKSSTEMAIKGGEHSRVLPARLMGCSLAAFSGPGQAMRSWLWPYLCALKRLEGLAQQDRQRAEQDGTFYTISAGSQ